MQSPFGVKDFGDSIPAWLIAFSFLVSLGVWTAKQLKGIFGVQDKSNTNSEDGLSPKQELQVRKLIEDLVVKTGEKGGLHDLKNKVTSLLWQHEEDEKNK